MDPSSQWLFIINESMKRKINITEFTESLAEGENVAFIYNTTKIYNSCDVINYLKNY